MSSLLGSWMAVKAPAATGSGVGRIATAIAIATLLITSACTVGPTYHQPAMHVPDSYSGRPDTRLSEASSEASPDEAQLSQWWRQFHDPELETLVMRALHSNLDLLSAASRIRQARQQEIIAGAALLPSISSSADAVRLHSNSSPLAALGGSSSSSSAGGGASAPGTGAASSGATTLNLYSLGFDASWEVDVFGGTRRSVEAAQANTEAAVWDLRDAQVSLSAEVANAYLTLRTLQARLQIVQESAQHQQSLLELAAARAKAGFVTELDVNQQRSQLAATTAQLPALDAQVQAQIHALSLLLGQEPQSTAAELSAAGPVPEVPLLLPPGLPSDLLRRRPDIRRAERQLSAATADVGVAVAGLYPKFNLIGAVTLASSSTGSLFSGRSLTSVGLGMISWPLFASGRLRANVRASEEQQQQAYLAYRKSVLAALQDAEDALVRYESEQQRLGSLQQSLAAAASSQHIAEEQYRNGLVTFINVLTATTTELSARDEVLQSTQALAQDLVALYKALGGGWEDQG